MGNLCCKRSQKDKDGIAGYHSPMKKNDPFSPNAPRYTDPINPDKYKVHLIAYDTPHSKATPQESHREFDAIHNKVFRSYEEGVGTQLQSKFDDVSDENVLQETTLVMSETTTETRETSSPGRKRTKKSTKV